MLVFSNDFCTFSISFCAAFSSTFFTLCAFSYPLQDVARVPLPSHARPLCPVSQPFQHQILQLPPLTSQVQFKRRNEARNTVEVPTTSCEMWGWPRMLLICWEHASCIRFVKPSREKYGEILFCYCFFCKDLVHEIHAGKKQLIIIYLAIETIIIWKTQTLCQIKEF